MKFNFLKNGYSELMNTNVFNTFGLNEKDFYLSDGTDLILVFKNELKESRNFIMSEYNRFAFKKAVENELDSETVIAETDESSLTRALANDFNTLFSLDGRKLENPDYSIGNGNCAYAFVKKSGKLYLSIPNFFITLVKELGESSGEDAKVCVDLRASKLIKKVFGNSETVKVGQKRSYYVFEDDNYKVIVKTKEFNGSYPKHIGALKIAKESEMKKLDVEKIKSILEDYKYEDYLNSDIKFVANKNYIFNIKDDNYYLTSDMNSDVECYENFGNSSNADINFTTSCEIMNAVLKELPGLKYIKYKKENTISDVDSEMFNETNIFASENNDKVIYFN